MTKHEIIEAYIAGQIDRRGFMKRLTAIGVSAAAAAAYAQSLAPSASAVGMGRGPSGYFMAQTEPYGTAGEFGSDLEAGEFLLSVDTVAIQFYDSALETLSAEDFAPENIDGLASAGLLGSNAVGIQGSGSPLDGRLIIERLRSIRDQTATHIETLEAAVVPLGSSGVEVEGTFNLAFTSASEFLEVARELHDVAVSAYTTAAPAIEDVELRSTATAIATVKGRHAAFINLLAGESPFPSTFDRPAGVEDVEDQLDQLVADA
jgi:hypothetical protein